MVPSGGGRRLPSLKQPAPIAALHVCFVLSLTEQPNRAAQVAMGTNPLLPPCPEPISWSRFQGEQDDETAGC